MYQRQQHAAIFIGLTILLMSFPWGSAQATSIFINEIHYDNAGTDTGEAIEIAGPAGTDLTGWSILRYNGATGNVYGTSDLTGTINGLGTFVVTYSTNGLQNGAPDGLALVDGTNNVIQFLSYEGSFTAIGGLASGLMSMNIGVTESGSTPIGHSLQLTGSGSDSGDFTWVTAMANTFGDVNTGQTFTGSNQQPVPEPSTLLFFSSGIVGLGFWRWRQKR